MRDDPVLVVLPAYNAARTLERTIAEIPAGAVDALLLVDDASADETVALAERLDIPTRVHTENRGYGANQKTCYATALEGDAAYIVMLHPDYQYDPALIPAMVERLRSGECDVVLGSRMLDGNARKGGMPWWKRLGNRFLTTVQNRLLGTSLSEFHTGYRAFTREALERSGFERFADGFVFDAQMLVSLVYRGARIGEVACPARYLPEASSVGFLASLRYGLGCIATALRYRLNRLGFYPAGWLSGGDPAPLPIGAPDAVVAALAIWFGLSRFVAGADWRAPIRNYDSWSYVLQHAGDGAVDLVSFAGRAPRLWPVPWLYSLFATDQSRVLAQMALSTAAWIGLAVAVGSAVRNRTLASASVLAVLALGLTSQAASWDALIMPESLGITLSVAAVALLIRHVRSPSIRGGAVFGAIAGLLALTRPLLAPVIAVLAEVELIRSILRRRSTSAAVALPAILLVAWLAFLLPRQEAAYGTFEREVRGTSSADYGVDAFASVLYGRLIGNPATSDWLARMGAPPLEPGMDPPTQVEDKVGWGRFRAAVGGSAAWQAWIEDNGGPLVALRAAIAEPVAHLAMLSGDLPLILEAPWSQPSFPEYGPGAAVPLLAEPYFRSAGAVPTDIAVLVGLGVLAIVLARRRHVWESSAVFRVGLGVTVSSVFIIVAGWFLVGIELVRHTVPGPLGLRLGLVLLMAGAADAAVRPRGGATDG